MGTDRLVLGGRFGERPDAVSFALLDAFRARGGRAVETAAAYAGGEAERQIGRWLRSRGAALRIVDKIGHGTTGSDAVLDPAALARECAAALGRLGVERIDVVLLHRDEPARPVAEIAAAMEAMVRRGWIGGWGVSNWSLERIFALRAACADTAAFDWVSLHHSLARARPARLWPGARAARAPEVERLCAAGFAFLAWSSQARGWFSSAAQAKCDLFAAFDTPANRARRARAAEYGVAHGLSASAVALAYVLSRQPRLFASIGPETLAELDDSLHGAAHAVAPAALRALAR